MRSNIISSQGVHDRYGGVVPEVAARHHLALINDVVDDALRTADVTLDDVDLVAVTQGPGLVGALLVGVATAKGLAAGRGLPLAPVDHLQGHVAANFLGDRFEPPFLCLVASGGHTFLARVEDHAGYTVLGRTLDDAAGEAFDKGARMLGLPYPGGPALERLAAEGDPAAYDFPIAAGVAGLDFSFAGLKTALLYKVRDLGDAAQARRADLAAAYQRAIVEALALRVERGLRATGLAAAGRRRRRGGQRAAARAHGRPRRRAARPRARAVHRQRGDDRLRGALGDAAARVRRPRRLRQRGARDLSLVLYGRPGCHLCDEARTVLERIGHPFEEVDIEADDELLARYLVRIPVIALDGDELYDFFVNEADLRARLAARVRRA